MSAPVAIFIPEYAMRDLHKLKDGGNQAAITVLGCLADGTMHAACMAAACKEVDFSNLPATIQNKLMKYATRKGEATMAETPREQEPPLPMYDAETKNYQEPVEETNQPEETPVKEKTTKKAPPKGKKPSRKSAPKSQEATKEGRKLADEPKPHPAAVKAAKPKAKKSKPKARTKKSDSKIKSKPKGKVQRGVKKGTKRGNYTKFEYKGSGRGNVKKREFSDTPAGMLQSLILKGSMTDAQIWARLTAKYPLPDARRGYISWTRHYMRKQGVKVPARVVAKKR